VKGEREREMMVKPAAEITVEVLDTISAQDPMRIREKV